MKINKQDLHWLAGILEGEGCFMSKYNRLPRITCEMTDLDVIKKIQSLAGGKIYKPVKRKSHWKQSWIWTDTNSEATYEFMKQIKPLMFSRRQMKITECLRNWETVCRKRETQHQKYIEVGQYYKSNNYSLRHVAKKFSVGHETVRKYAELV